MSIERDPPIRVVLAETSCVIRELLVAMLDEYVNVEMTAICSEGRELRSAMAVRRPDVLVTDIRMPPARGDEGLRVARRLGVTSPEVGVVMLSQYDEPAYALMLLETGPARAYLRKERVRSKGELVGAVEAVARGDTRIDSEVVRALMEARAHSSGSPLPSLTGEQRELLAMTAEGKTPGAIAELRALTEGSVEEQIRALFSKLDLPETETTSRRAQAALAFLAGEGRSPPKAASSR